MSLPRPEELPISKFNTQIGFEKKIPYPKKN